MEVALKGDGIAVVLDEGTDRIAIWVAISLRPVAPVQVHRIDGAEVLLQGQEHGKVMQSTALGGTERMKRLGAIRDGVDMAPTEAAVTGL